MQGNVHVISALFVRFWNRYESPLRAELAAH
jgi:hypothetical protein